MNVNFETHTSGKTQYSEENRLVIINSINIGFSSLELYPELPFYGELQAHFNPDGFTLGSWNIAGYGIIYSDRLWLKEFRQNLRNIGLSVKAVKDVKYSDKASQYKDYVSLDITEAFYASWKRLLKEGKVS